MKGRNAMHNTSAFYEIAASLSFGLLDRRVPHFVAWMSEETGDIRRIRIDDEESFYLFLSFYLSDEMKHSDKEIREVYRERYKNELYRKDICVNTQLEIFQNGELLTKLDVENIEDECEKLELLL